MAYDQETIGGSGTHYLEKIQGCFLHEAFPSQCEVIKDERVHSSGIRKYDCGSV